MNKIIPWNKGLTKETDEKVKRNAKHVGISIKNLFKKRKMKIWNKGLTKFTDIRVKKLSGKNSSNKRKEVKKKISIAKLNHKVTKKTRKKIRESVIKFQIKNPKILEKFIRSGKKSKSKYKTKQGFLVRSKAEQKISNWFYNNKIKCFYEPMFLYINNKHIFVPDFYLPEYHLFIEYYGNFRNFGNKRINIKKKIYKQYKINVLNIENTPYQKINKFLTKKWKG